MGTTDNAVLLSMYKNSLANDDIFMCGITVDTGFEWLAVDECKELIARNLETFKDRGKVYFNIHKNQFSNVQELRSVDNIFIVGDVSMFNFDKDGNGDLEDDIKLIKDHIKNNIKLKKALDFWKQTTGFPGIIYPTKEQYEEAKIIHLDKKKQEIIPVSKKRGSDPSKAEINNVLKYRVTCERIGKHSFESNDVAAAVGGELQDKYLWIVDLKFYHLEVLCHMQQNLMITKLWVTFESKHHRNIVSFGPTTLRATICYNLLRLAKPRIGDFIVDLMCGGGSISIESALSFPWAFNICGDNHDKAVARTKINIDATCSEKKIDLLSWDGTKSPLKSSCVDIIITDLPFGRRLGYRSRNEKLYKQFLSESARILRDTTGCLVMMTQDRRHVNLALEKNKNFFRTLKIMNVNVGGLSVAVYVLRRTTLKHYEVFEC